ncbi:MAG TPA: hypothetical protein VK453_25135 [Micromonosporaceae bacterium]|nr:hypothetical protein [Micromonosporaceae bacterium]
MPIASLQRRLTQVGVIRLGEKRLSKNNKEYPAALDSFRITSPSKALIDAVAGLYGGTVKPWQSPSGPEFEVVTRATEIPVFVPPQNIDPNFELWGNGYRSRMCDGIAEKLRGQPCLCEAAAQQRYAAAKRPFPEDGRFERTKDDCKPTTRMSLMLADIPSMGTLKLEAHGWNAASELPTLAASIAAATQPIPALLKLEARGDKKLTFGKDGEKVESRNYVVPVLDFFGLFTPAQAFGGAIDAAVRTAIGAPQEQRVALPAAPSPSASEVKPSAPTVDWAARVAAATTTNAVNELMGLMRSAGVRDPQLVDAWKAKAAQVAEASATAKSADTQTIDAEEEPNKDDVWTAIMRAAQPLKWNLPAIEEKYRAHMGHDPSDDEVATGFKYAEFLAAVRAGQVK